MALERAYRAAVRELEARGVMPESAPSLEPMKVALGRLRLEMDPERTIIVAGTNGKGSVSATLESLYLEQGERTGLYTSPHLVEVTERIRIGGEDISQELFLRAYEKSLAATFDLKLSHFEMLTVMAAWIFFSPDSGTRVSRVILEVGLGGIWDATNAIPHSRCVITRLGLDHQNLLGSTLPEIARNKFGVIPQKGPWAPKGASVVSAPLDASVQALAKETRERTECHWVECMPFDLETRPGQSPAFVLKSRFGEHEISLPGRRGAENTALALTAYEYFGGNVARSLRALSRVRWPGRMQRLEWKGSPCPVYLSGDHNPQGVESLIELLGAYPRKKLLILVGVGVDKDAGGMLERLASIPDAEIHLSVTPFKGRKLTSDARSGYGEWLGKAAGAWEDPVQGLKQILTRADRESMILVTGSLYLVGAVYGSYKEGLKTSLRT